MMPLALVTARKLTPATVTSTIGEADGTNSEKSFT